METVAISTMEHQASSKLGWLSLSTASWLSDFANLGLIASLVVGVLSTIVIVWTSGAKEEYWNRDRQAAQKEIARLNNRAEEAILQQDILKQTVSWRTLTHDQATILTEELSRTGGIITLAYVQNDPETLSYTALISRVFIPINLRSQPSLWTVQSSPRILTDRLIWGLHIYGKRLAVVNSVRAAFRLAGITFSEDEVPDTGGRIGGMVFGSIEPNSDVVILVGVKRPLL